MFDIKVKEEVEKDVVMEGEMESWRGSVGVKGCAKRCITRELKLAVMKI